MFNKYAKKIEKRMKVDGQDWMRSGAVLRLSQEHLLIGHGCFDWKSKVDLQKEMPAFYFPDFFLQNPKPWIQFSKWKIVTVQELNHALEDVQDQPSSLKWHCPYQGLFYQTFNQLQKEFSSSLLSKAVPYVFAYAQEFMTPTYLTWSMKKALAYIARYPGYLYGFWVQNEGMLGVTPEILFSCRGKSLQTMALAGTSSKRQDKFKFLNSFKEHREHKLVIEGIGQSLNRLGRMHIGEMQVLELPTLNHLWTPIHIELKQEANFDFLVQRLHPTPALGAFPKSQGQQWLSRYQQQLNRGRYGAPAGVFYAQEQISHCLVAIRNIQWNANQTRIGAGCGVIRESNCDLEWKEVQLKIRAIQESFGL